VMAFRSNSFLNPEPEPGVQFGLVRVRTDSLNRTLPPLSIVVLEACQKYGNRD
jgi:hypothetical protein